MNLAREENEISFYHTSFSLIKNIIKEINKENSIALLRDFDEELVVYSNPNFKRKEFQSFIRNNEFPLVAPCIDKIIGTIYKEEYSRTGIILFRNKSSKNAEFLDKQFKNLANDINSLQYTFILADFEDSNCIRYAEFQGISSKDLPIMEIVLMKNDEEQRYLFNGSFEEKSMMNFWKSWKEGKAKRFYKTEDLPESNPGPVFKVVGKSFQKEVIENDINVFVKFYAPWCRQCQELTPVYKHLAKEYGKNKYIKFVEIDSSKNEVQKQYPKGLPTLLLFKDRNKNNPIEYKGKRSLLSLKKFLEKNEIKVKESDL